LIEIKDNSRIAHNFGEQKTKFGHGGVGVLGVVLIVVVVLVLMGRV
jgi:hypothetical protein